jgi:transposase-like protein
MSQHFQRSSAARNFSLGHVDHLSDREIIETLAEWRWKLKGMQVCPKCGMIANHKWRNPRSVWRCRGCEAEFSVTSGTPFANHRIPLRTILKGIVLFVNSAHSVSADKLMKDLGVSHKTAWLFRNRLRAALSATRPTEKLGGIVQIDGGYFCGKPRKANQRKKKDADAIKDKIIDGKKARKRLSRQDVKNLEKRKKRRVAIVIREIGGGPNQASYKTRIFVTTSENEADATSMVRSCVAPGSIVMTDECAAYNRLCAYYDHRVVQHSIEYSTSDGVNDNQCESFFSRPRRCELGVSHNMYPQYLQAQMDEFAWREDSRHLTNLEIVNGLVRRVFNAGLSKFRGYYQWPDKRGKEMLWKSFESEVDGEFGMMSVVSVG